MRTAFSVGLVFALALGCGGEEAPPTEERPAEGSATPATDPPAEPPSEVVPPPPPPPRVEVVAPVDLAAAIAARLPTLEIVPQSCSSGSEPLGLTEEQVCVRDAATGLSRATRRFATSDLPSVDAGRTADDVIFAVVDFDNARTRYAGHLWRWNLTTDTYDVLAGGFEDLPRIDTLDFGVWIQDYAGVASDRLFVGGELTRLRAVEEVPERIRVAEGRTYHLHMQGRREVLEAVHFEPPRLVFERIADYPRSANLSVAFPEGQSLIATVYPRGRTTSLYVVSPPAAEVLELTLAVTRPRTLTFVDGHLQITAREGRFVIELPSGTLTPLEAPPTEGAEGTVATVATGRPHSSSIHGIYPVDGTLVIRTSWGMWALGPEGVATYERPADEGGDEEEEEEEEEYEYDDGAPRYVRSGCRCEEARLTCGETVFEGACTAVADLERMSVIEEEDLGQGATIYTRTLRIDRLEPDYLRLTRLSDGARIWVRVYGSNVFAQGDDGAYQFAGPIEGHALRWGRSILDAPISPLVPHRAAFERSTLVADFFSGRPLPAADTTLPASE